MHKTYLTSFIAASCALALALPNAAHANITVYQHQSSSSSIEIECSGDCSAKSESSQSQTQRVGDPVWHRENHYAPRLNRRANQLSYGQARASWSHRGGTCTIRYTEAAARWYKYSTSTACDAGEITVGGLVPGKAYRFQVQQDGGNWGRPMRLVAW